MTDVSLIVVGINYWEDLTMPFIVSMAGYEPEAEILVIDNYSKYVYPNKFPHAEIIRTDRRMGYNEAMNFGIQHRKADRYVCFNNDCLCEGPFMHKIEPLDEDVLWGSKEKPDPLNGIMFVASAWLVISDKILQDVGYFDKRLDAGFEELDYEMRALTAGYQLDVIDLPIKHLARSTRYHEPRYVKRWNMCRKYFCEKHRIKMMADDDNEQL